MDFGRYLHVVSGKISTHEYGSLLKAQHQHGLNGLKKDSSGLIQAGQIGADRDFRPVGIMPAGETLLRMGDTAERLLGNADGNDAARARLASLISEWQEWHRDNIEPICTYSTSTYFGHHMFDQVVEKKLVACLLAMGPLRNRETILHSNDIIVIPEGSSGTYVGLGIAARPDSRVRVRTSNAGLIREYQDNPALRPRFPEFRLIGGQACADQGGVEDAAAMEQFRDAISHDPGATVVIMTVSALLPGSGPHTDGPTLGTKQMMVHESLTCGTDQRGVRELVCVADYTKHIDAGRRDLGAPFFGEAEWRHIVDKHRSKICVVTAPPPVLRCALKLQLASDAHDVARRNLDLIEKDPEFQALGLAFEARDYAYDRAAKVLRNMAGASVAHGTARSMFHEAYAFSDAGGQGNVSAGETADLCVVSGLYRSSGQCGHSFEVTVPEGRRFPACPDCHHAAIWTLTTLP